MTDKKMVGFLICSYNDEALSAEMWPTLLESLEFDEATKEFYDVVVVDAGSEQKTIDFWKQELNHLPHHCKSKLITGDCDFVKNLGLDAHSLKRLSVSLNVGIWWLMMIGCEYVVHIHPDMKFFKNNWVNELVKFADNNPKAGKIAADCVTLNQGTRFGNQTPWLLSKNAIVTHMAKFGRVFDPNFVELGWEDHDFCREELTIGLCPWICGTSLVYHGEGMGTRKQRDTNPAMYYNADYFMRKWQIKNYRGWDQDIEPWWKSVEWKH